MRVLITGAAGKVGTTLVKALHDRYELYGLDRAPMPHLARATVGDVADYEVVRQASEGMDAIIHLAGMSYVWEEVLHDNLIGTYNVFEAARQNRVRRLAYASRAGLLGPYPKAVQRTVDMLPRPESLYSLSKVFGEGLGYMYASQYGLEVVAVRIGNFRLERDQPEHPHHLSHGDAARVFEQAIIAPLDRQSEVPFAVVFGVSDSNWPLYDLEHGRRAIGYDPQDYADVPPEERS